MENKTKTYTVKWEIQVDADSHEDAAKEAMVIMQDPESTATVFSVTEFGGGAVCLPPSSSHVHETKIIDVDKVS